MRAAAVKWLIGSESEWMIYDDEDDFIACFVLFSPLCGLKGDFST